MIISLIAAIGNNNELGKNNQLLFHLAKDLQHFKNNTWGLPIILGRKTFDSFQQKQLPGRHHLIFTNQKNNILPSPLITCVSSVEEAITVAKKDAVKKMMIIGGASIYQLFLPFATELIFTRVNANFEADVFFPAIDFSQWHLTETYQHQKDERHAYDFEFETWQKQKL